MNQAASTVGAFGTGRGPVVTQNTMVSTGHPLATATGLRVLMEGGNAFDAAIAAAATIAVVEPSSNHVGGDVFALCRPASSGVVEAVNASGPAPSSISRADYPGEIPKRGLRSATLPGAVAAWDLINDRWGTKSVDALLGPAISYATDGFAVDIAFVTTMQSALEEISHYPSTMAVLCPGGRPLAPGDKIIQPDLAQTLRDIAADGADGFYQGRFAEHLIRASQTEQGAWTEADFEASPAELVQPLRTFYRGYEVLEQPLPSQGYLLLAYLNIVEGFDLSSLQFGSPDCLHIMIEAKKLAGADRHAYVGDPAHVEAPIHTLVSKEFAARRRMMLNPARASNVYGPGDPSMSGRDTTALSVVDGDGNAITLIQSVFHQYGSAYIVPGTGVLLNNRMNGFSLDPESPNVLAGGKRPIHTLNTYMVQQEGELTLLGGSPGGQYQTQANFQVISNLIDHGMHWQAAIDAPRWYHDEDTGAVSLETRFDSHVAGSLEQRGHSVEWTSAFTEHARSQGIMLTPSNGARYGATDPRWHGQVLGY